MRLPKVTSDELVATIEGLADIRRSVLDDTEVAAIDDAILFLIDYREVAALAEMMHVALQQRDGT